MPIAALVVNAVLVAAMLATSAVAAVALPARARVPVHFGPRSYNNWVPKVVGLLLWPAAGIVIAALILGTVPRSGHHTLSAAVVVLPVVLAVLLAAQVGAVRAARMRAGQPAADVGQR
jgi:hypothetical protein